MKIQSKLSLFVFAVILMLSVNSFILFYNNYTTVKLDHYMSRSYRLLNQFQSIQNQSNAILINETGFNKVAENWLQAVRDFEYQMAEYEEVSGSSFVPEEIREKSAKVSGLWTHLQKDIGQANDAIVAIRTSELIKKLSNNSFIRVRYSTDWSREESDLYKDVMLLEDRMNKLDRSSEFVAFGIDDTVDSLIRMIDERNARWMLISSAVFVLILLLSSVFVILFSRNLAGRIVVIEGLMNRVAERDLTVRYAIKSTDEIGHLGGHLNSVLDSLRDFFNSVNGTIHRADELKEILSSGMTESASAMEEIFRNIESFEGQFEKLDAELIQSRKEIAQLDGDVQLYSAKVANQAEKARDSGDMMKTIVDEIGKVGSISSEQNARARDLLLLVEENRDSLEKSIEAVESVAEGMQGIHDIVAIIKSIADQTNILAMNAAIEAAHAGDAGKGFSVVAEEIRKLAESSAENVSRIDKFLSSISKDADITLERSRENNETFEKIGEEVLRYSQVMDEVHRYLDTLVSRGNEVQKTSRESGEVSHDLSQGIGTITDRSKALDRSMEIIGEHSTSTFNGIREITLGTKEILSSFDLIRKSNEENVETVNSLREEMKTYRVTEIE
ncbi:MAG: methyl-accepting chemotaxis protein [Spirochaetales bacterium]|nr:methyl-accepting chemotaxis protein [Spirochaetales bacterium]